MTDELMEAVDDLTAPRNVKVHTDNGITWATEDALLVQLQDAITSTTSRAGGRSLGHERMILDADALMRFHQITAAIGDWCRIEDVKIARKPRDPVADLRAWHAARIQRPADQREGDEFYIAQMTGWANLIRGKLTPRKKLEWVDPCPECDATHYTEEEGGTVARPVLIDYDPNRPFQSVKWECRACGTIREGEFAVRYLARASETRGEEITHV